ncbi:MAG: Asp-tRNA(Asn)/Glu-tRNA(Gln) amidotransferase subunit GatA [Candidatus Bathyarchaeota archaeon]|nr:Asp-tRNA(Asn)/Glu-tRNA(Gln) amidotransferase subunit GatA [Candidatus Bathyarchaeum tardum]WGM90026.1 MAG: Asp-tRNA(Asn)/Glu-tRNA(Gln) amidotransferase subunit GatA [Candidatus Bathyarchaeum tardum]
MSDLHKLTAQQTIQKIKSKEASAQECLEAVFEQIHKVEDKINAFVTLVEDQALNRAKEIDKKISEGKKVGKLAGVSIAIKDAICTQGILTTCSSKMLENFVPPYNAEVINRIKQQDGIIIGKTNMDEFAMGSSTETSYFGPTFNPWDNSRVPGGSSGGSAACIATDEAVLSLGTDTGGSIRCPASYCSVVGLKPTYGLVSRYGLIAYANSLEQIGPMAKDVYDCALFLSVIAGHDTKDGTSVNQPIKDYTQFLKNGVKGLKIGVPKEFFGEGTKPDVKKQVWNAIHKLEELGASYEETSLPSLEQSLAAYYIVAMSEASSNLARFDGLRYGYRIDKDEADWATVYSKNRRTGFGAEVRRRIILGTYALSAGYYNKYYLKALKVRTLIRKNFEEAYKKFDVLMGPTMPFPPFKIGEKIEDPLQLYMSDVDTVSANLAGLPAISVPCGFTKGLPVGLQILAPHLREDLTLQVAYTFEQNTEFSKQKPKL